VIETSPSLPQEILSVHIPLRNHLLILSRLPRFSREPSEDERGNLACRRYSAHQQKDLQPWGKNGTERAEGRRR